MYLFKMICVAYIISLILKFLILSLLNIKYICVIILIFLQYKTILIESIFYIIFYFMFCIMLHRIFKASAIEEFHRIVDLL